MTLSIATLAFATVLALGIGLGLGLLGGGGSILTLPVLVYALGVEEKSAIATSLFIVGVTSAVAAVSHARNGNVKWRVALPFAPSAMLGAFAGGRAAEYVPSAVLLIAFAVLMLGAAAAMWRGRSASPSRSWAAPTASAARARGVVALVALGLVVGAITGLVGAGGGFIIVPALVLFTALPMSAAVGTSLLIIALNSFAGFAGHITHTSVNWPLTLLVSAVAIVGALAGGALSTRIAPKPLRRAFAILLLFMGGFVFVEQAVALAM